MNFDMFRPVFFFFFAENQYNFHIPELQIPLWAAFCALVGFVLFPTSLIQLSHPQLPKSSTDWRLAFQSGGAVTYKS